MERDTNWSRRGRSPAVLGALLAAAALLVAACGQSVGAAPSPDRGTATPIKHVVVIFQENISFDHYFGTYPNATNKDGTPFTPAPGTPAVNGLTPELLTHNPNQFQPQRLSPSQALTCDQDHDYSPEQKSFDGGKMDQFVQNTEHDTCTGQPVIFGTPGLVMDYYDGNTVTGLWNYAQRFSMSDNSFGTVFGPSTPGALNLISGQTHGGQAVDPKSGQPVTDPEVVHSPDKNGVGTVIGDPDPAFDDCADKNHTANDNLAAMQGRNVGDLLNARGVSWGWFQGGFRPTGTANGFSVCGASHANIGGNSVVDYSPHHEPFEYYKSTANQTHKAPSSASAIGSTDQANHQYDLTDFSTALQGGNLPAVSFLKASEYQDGHAGYSDPLDEQTFLVNTLNSLQKSKDWASTAVVVAYDDSDGWYDHQPSKIVNGSEDNAEDTAMCMAKQPVANIEDRCGYGPRLPLLVISPFSKVNHVDHTLTDQTSVLRFIEDNWRTGRIGGGSYDAMAGSLDGMFDFRSPQAKPVQLDPKTGAVTGG